jgi:hypothetical protein
MMNRIVFLPIILLLQLLSCRSPATVVKTNTPDFQAETLDDEVEIGYGLGIGDVDGDGKLDVLLADKKQFVWYRNGDWQRFVMADSLTERDNVCLAVKDINGDGQVEVAVGAQWNPGETSDEAASGAVFYLIRPDDPTQKWEAVQLPHEPTVHRMHWVKVGNTYQLVVLPLHGRGNQNGEGAGVKVYAYQMPEDVSAEWSLKLIDSSMHMTHNFDVILRDGREALLMGGKEGAKMLEPENGRWPDPSAAETLIGGEGFGEIRQNGAHIFGIQPMHGNELVVYTGGVERKVLTASLKQGHALAIADLLGSGSDQVVFGWREANDQGEMGIQLIRPEDANWNTYQTYWIDKNGMACEDLKIADLNGDGKPDIIAAGRSTHNLKVYWNRSGEKDP